MERSPMEEVRGVGRHANSKYSQVWNFRRSYPPTSALYRTPKNCPRVLLAKVEAFVFHPLPPSAPPPPPPSPAPSKRCGRTFIPPFHSYKNCKQVNRTAISTNIFPRLRTIFAQFYFLGIWEIWSNRCSLLCWWTAGSFSVKLTFLFIYLFRKLYWFAKRGFTNLCEKNLWLLRSCISSVTHVNSGIF